MLQLYFFFCSSERREPVEFWFVAKFNLKTFSLNLFVELNICIASDDFRNGF